MQIFVRTIIGKHITIDLEEDDTILTLKNKIYDKEGIPPERQRISTGIKTLFEDNALVSDFDVKNNSTVNLFVKIC
jgi:hypothetical protein